MRFDVAAFDIDESQQKKDGAKSVENGVCRGQVCDGHSLRFIQCLFNQVENIAGVSFGARVGCFFIFEHVLYGFEVVQGNGARCMDPLAFGVDDGDEAIDVFSLQVLAERIDRTFGVCGKDGVGQVGHHIGQCVFVAVERGVEQASLYCGV